MNRRKVDELLDMSLDEGTVVVVEDVESTNAKAILHWIWVLIHMTIGFVLIGMAFSVWGAAIEGDPPRHARVLGVLSLFLAFVPLSLAGYHMITPTYLRKMKFYDNGIAFMVLDWFRGPFSVHLPWFELGKYRRRRHWRFGDIVYLPKYKLVVLGSMKGYEEVLSLIEDNLIEDYR